MYALTERLESMINLFREEGLKFEEKKYPFDEPYKFGKHAAELVCHQLEQNEILVKN